MDRFQAMSIVLAVAETGSLSAAARRTKTPLATVSRKVSELEAHLQTKLFNRSSRVLVPTDVGRSYIAAAKRILGDVAETERAASGEYAAPRGELSVSAPPAFGRLHLVPVLAKFVAAFPDVDIHLDLRDQSTNLLEEHIDVALRIGTLADSSLIAVGIGEIRRVLCASPAYLKTRGTPKSPDDLSRHDCISSVPPLQSTNTWTLQKANAEYVVPVRSRLVLNSIESAFEAARAGMGIAAIASYQVTESVRSGELALLLQDFDSPSIPVSFVYPPNRFMPAKLRAFLDFALPRLKARIGDLPRPLAPGSRAKRPR
ncbi:LysR family transcriptional regulator [Bradyrhizobium sp. CCBAU 11357]|uniref:LysR family transcriptional regulator n=1 Tax=Bradyrhizobium sp. CCBAU 11357 TaxID=1630808 RepID=UPI0023041BD2|nr:LysR family transcriptional regulator [Bradyrhizobium sp. CCBAU 11357]MDA9499196.1 LysR family transcriptional regulator [Bradyrhizobium sp. CCBAU 11357]